MTASDNSLNKAGQPAGPARVFRSLRYRNYRLFFIGQGISLIGTWMQTVAMGWLVYRMTSSAFLLGVISFASLICVFLFSPLAGVLSDRFDCRRIMLITQGLSMVQALTLAAVVLTGTAAVWNLIALSAALGLINSFDMPARQSLILDLVEDKADLGNAIALNSSLFNGARLIGPAIAGILVALVGEGICFLINGLSFIVVLACLLSMRLNPRGIVPTQDNFFSGMKEGLAYASSFPPIKYTLILLSLSALVAMPYAVLLPVFAREVLQGNANTLGFLVSAAGCGALVGAIYLASFKDVRGLLKMIIIAAIAFGAGLVLFSFSHVLWLSLLFIAIAGFGMVTQMAATNTLLQLIADDDKRGRVISFYIVSFNGVSPFGSLLYGWLASIIGVSFTVLAGGLCCMSGGLLFIGRFKSIKYQVLSALYKKGLVSEPPASED